MKVAAKKPESFQTVVYVTKDQYEVWFSKPQSLGKINNRNGYWYTADGMRFVSSRDAMYYIVRQTDPTVALPERTRGPVKERAQVPEGPSSRRVSVESPVNQNHPRFQDFLDFQEFMARRKAGRVEGATSVGGASTEK